MHELHRAEYLSALGVTSYMPRFRLPLAPEPRQARLPVEELPMENREPSPGTAEPQLRQRAEGPPEIAVTPEAPTALRDIGALTEQVRAAPQPQSAPAELTPPQQQVQPFVLSCWWLGDELLAVDSREPGAALPVEALFNNIARALGWHQLPREQDRLRWPLAENRFGPAAAASDARDTCSSWLEAASVRRPVKSIWLMGRQARDFCSPLSLKQPLAEPVTEWNGIRLVAMPSLTELLQQPERKRALWQLLRETYPEHTRFPDSGVQ
ncbi:MULTISPECIES: hypothetical protein [unclassified Microbulbifer]|uniref:hypothetical protein n=1 Tax=unclassified Microbulbifer TaxID=2619833 RepID=UPI0027E50391|nr:MULTISPECIES: hypothetical protein [unclassified Microbulbifer]